MDKDWKLILTKLVQMHRERTQSNKTLELWQKSNLELTKIMILTYYTRLQNVLQLQKLTVTGSENQEELENILQFHPKFLEANKMNSELNRQNMQPTIESMKEKEREFFVSKILPIQNQEFSMGFMCEVFMSLQSYYQKSDPRLSAKFSKYLAEANTKLLQIQATLDKLYKKKQTLHLSNEALWHSIMRLTEVLETLHDI